MNNKCEFCGGGYCLCNTCQAVKQAMEEADKISKEEVDKILSDAEKALKGCEENEQNK